MSKNINIIMARCKVCKKKFKKRKKPNVLRRVKLSNVRKSTCVTCSPECSRKYYYEEYIIFFVSFLLSINLVFAGTTTLSNEMGLKIGDCWNNKLITNISDDNLSIIWEKGCSQETKSESSHKRDFTLSTDSSPDNNCQPLITNGEINIFVQGDYSKEEMINFGKWVVNIYNNETPFNETTYSLYYEKELYSCRETAQEKNNDIRINIGYANGFRAFGVPGFAGAGRITFNNYETWRFLLMHESGHVYGIGHTNDGSIMDIYGGNEKFNEWEINTIRSNLI